jgi:hypothetical protein
MINDGGRRRHGLNTTASLLVVICTCPSSVRSTSPSLVKYSPPKPGGKRHPVTPKIIVRINYSGNVIRYLPFLLLFPLVDQDEVLDNQIRC